MEEQKEKPKCKGCEHIISKRQKFSATLHCALHEDMMDVTKVVEQNGRTLFCPLTRKGE